MSTLRKSTIEWITTTDAAECIGCTAEHVSLLIRTGRIRAEKFGVVWAVEKKSVLQFAKLPQKTGRPRVRHTA